MAHKEESESANAETNQISAVVNALAVEAENNLNNLRWDTTLQKPNETHLIK